MAVAFVRAGDHANHERLCRLLFALRSADSSAMDAERFAKVCFLSGKSLPMDIQLRGLELARFAVAKRNRDWGPFWTCHSGGMAEYHAGDLNKALELLLEAEESNEVGCKGGAMVYRAMALKRLGHQDEAAELLRTAEALLAEPAGRPPKAPPRSLLVGPGHLPTGPG
jgi:hypothetical protein